MNENDGFKSLLVLKVGLQEWLVLRVSDLNLFFSISCGTEDYKRITQITKVPGSYVNTTLIF
jgi:hypothetical protein